VNRLCIVVLFCFLTNYVSSQTVVTTNAQDIEQMISREKNFLYSIVDNLALYERPCSLSQYRLATYASIVVCADTEMSFDNFSAQFNQKTIALAEEADSEYVNLLDKAIWEKSLSAESSPYATGGVTEGNSIFAFFYTSYPNGG
jgi:hypothetical protein